MSTRHLASLLIAAAALSVAPATVRAQNDAAADQQAVTAQMQQLQMQVMQNMQAKGIDPQTFFQQIAGQMQGGGGIDMEALQQQLIDQGLIDRASIEQLQGSMKKAIASSLKQQLKASDEEWTVLQPKIQDVIDASARVGQLGQTGGRMTGLSGFIRPSLAGDEMTKLTRDLRAAVNDPNADEDAIAKKLAAWRAAHEKAQADLDSAKQRLVELLTPRQESILVTAGLL